MSSVAVFKAATW